MDAIARLEENGVIVIAFQIGAKNERFEKIWNSGSHPKGVFLGDNITALPKELLVVMKQLLKVLLFP